MAPRPVNIETEALQSPNPKGANKGAISLPKYAKKLSFIFSVKPLKLNDDNNHIATDIANITVTTLIKNPLDLFQVFFSNALNVGNLYSGNSSINGSISFLNDVLFKTRATNIATTIPSKYKDVVTSAAFFGKNIATKAAYIGNLAPQVLSG